MPSSSPAATSAAAEIQKLESSYGPKAAAAGHTAAILYSSNLAFVQALSVFLSILFIIGIAYFIKRTGWLRVRLNRVDDVIFKANPIKKHVKRSWDEVERHFFSGDMNDLKIAVIKADALLDDALHEIGIGGETLGDRLKNVKSPKLPNIDNIWEAHKIRNRIAHEGNFVLTRDMAEKALTVYEETLEHLGMLEKLPAIGEQNRSRK